MTKVKVDPFTLRRILKFTADHRGATGEFPTLKDFEAHGIARELIDRAVRDEELEQVYINLTNGTLVKGYRITIK